MYMGEESVVVCDFDVFLIVVCFDLLCFVLWLTYE